MPVNTTHPNYNADNAILTKDAYNGEVKHYVPRLRGQSEVDYKQYVQRPCYYNVTKRTTDALVGAMMRKPYNTNVEDVVICDDMTFDTFLAYTLRDIMLTSRAGILVDYNMESETPYLVPYDNNAITNWGDDYVIVREDYFEVDPKDKYSKTVACQYRELTLVDSVYTVNIWRLDGQKWKIYDTIVPSVRGRTLDFIPFVFINANDTTSECRDPVMLNVAKLNIGHFVSTAEVEQCAHFLALPQPYLAGGFAGEPEGGLCIGSPEIWLLEPGSTVGYLEYSGKGFESLMGMIAMKEDQMSQLGARLLTAKAGVETAEALRIRSAGENSTLIGLVSALEEGVKIVLQYYAIWMSENPEQVEFSMNRDFTNLTANAQETDGLLRLFQAGQISQDTLLRRLYEGEIVEDVEAEKQLLNSNA